MVKPLWNRSLQSLNTYSMYDSPTLSAHPGAGTVPSTVSLMCLGCHDGISSYAGSESPAQSKHVLLNIGGSKFTMNIAGGYDADSNVNCRGCHDSMATNQNLKMGWWYNDGLGIYEKDTASGIDLTDDHPISVSYTAAATAKAGQFVAASGQLVGTLPLYNSKVECATCHDPHKTTNGYFLRTTNAGSALCLTCHIK
ncbi:MAG: cytochrome c3 family protein [Nitrospirae bacterium]|nr:cytochrome c3 family protein [Nitrospirota bacterium]